MVFCILCKATQLQLSGTLDKVQVNFVITLLKDAAPCQHYSSVKEWEEKCGWESLRVNLCQLTLLHGPPPDQGWTQFGGCLALVNWCWCQESK